VLIVAPDQDECLELELSLPVAITAKSVRAASDTEGLGIEVVVIAGASALSELVEVRVHPQLYDKPVVLFLPGRDLPPVEWRSIRAWPVTDDSNAVESLVWHVRRLLSRACNGSVHNGSARSAER
jgi:hypothetical protein